MADVQPGECILHTHYEWSDGNNCYNVYLLKIPTGKEFDEFRARVDTWMRQENNLKNDDMKNLLLKHVVQEWHAGRGKSEIPEAVQLCISLQGVRAVDARYKDEIPVSHADSFTRLLSALGHKPANCDR